MLVDKNGRPSYGRYHSVRPDLGVLTSTARTFIQEGVTTQYATKVVGTILENGRIYAQLLTKSTRVLNDKDAPTKLPKSWKQDKDGAKTINFIRDTQLFSPNRVEPFLVFPTTKPQIVPQQQQLLKQQQPQQPRNNPKESQTSSESSEELLKSASSNNLRVPFAQEEYQNKYYQKNDQNNVKVYQIFPQAYQSENAIDHKALERQIRLKEELSNELVPSKVRAWDNIPTITVRNEFAPSGFSLLGDLPEIEVSTESNKRTTAAERKAKLLFKAGLAKPELKTVTYTGFADFTTTVGDTVIIFSPQTSVASGAIGASIQPSEALNIQVDNTATILQERQKQLNTEEQLRQLNTEQEKSASKETEKLNSDQRKEREKSAKQKNEFNKLAILPTMVLDASNRQREPKSQLIGEEREDMEAKSAVLAHEQQFQESTRIAAAPVFKPAKEYSTVLSSPEVIQPSERQEFQMLSTPSEEDIAKIVASLAARGKEATEPLQLDSSTVKPDKELEKEQKSVAPTLINDETKVQGGATTIFFDDGYFLDSTALFGFGSGGKYQGVEDTTQEDENENQTERQTESQTENQTERQKDLQSENQTERQVESTEADSISTNEISTSDDEGATETPAALDENEENYQCTDGVRIVPSTVYQTLTYLTTFFIPTEDSTSTSIKSNVVTSSEIDLQTRLCDDPGSYEYGTTTVKAVDKEEDKKKEEETTTFGREVEEVTTTGNEKTTTGTTVAVAKNTSETTTIGTEENTTTDRESEKTTFSTESEITTLDSEEEKTTFDAEKEVTTFTTETTKKQSTPEPNAKKIATQQNENQEITTMEIATESHHVTESEPETDTTTENGEEIELLFKTLYTTYTYLTTYFQGSTSSVESRIVVTTNVITSTLEPGQEASDVPLSELLEKDLLKTKAVSFEDLAGLDISPVVIDRPSIVPQIQEENSGTEEAVNDVNRKATPALSDEEILNTANVVKTYYTTYTYFTTIFVDGETEVSSRTEVYTNYVTEKIAATPVVDGENTKAPLLPRFKIESSGGGDDDGEDDDSTKKSNENSTGRESVDDTTRSTSPKGRTRTGTTLRGSAKTSGGTSRKSPILRGASTSEDEPVEDASKSDTTLEKPKKFRKRPNLKVQPTKVYSRTINRQPSSLPKEEGKQKEEIENKSPIKYRTLRRKLPTSTTTESSSEELLDLSEYETISTMVTDVRSSTSEGERIVLDAIDRRNILVDDQAVSESNNESEIVPSPTLLLQTSYTTFTYFTTIYQGTTASDIVSRLETVTNVVTETLTPTQKPTPEEATLPITYFTTFTYWTTLYKKGTTRVTSSEVTVSNVITPSRVIFTDVPTVIPRSGGDNSAISSDGTEAPSVIDSRVKEPDEDSIAKGPIFITPSSVVPASEKEVPKETERTEQQNVIESKEGAEKEEANEKHQEREEVPTIKSVPTLKIDPSAKKDLLETVLPQSEKDGVITRLIEPSAVTPREEELTTYFTTYTYYTTSYIGDSTVLNSRLETVSNVVGKSNKDETEVVSDNRIDSEESKTQTPILPTGLLSTIVSSQVNSGVTTLYSTDVYGTYIDGLYAKVLESTTLTVNATTATLENASSRNASSDISNSSSVLEPSPVEKIKPTGVVSINQGKIVDADGVSTLFYTTKAVGTYIDNLYAQVIESTSSLRVDEEKKSKLATDVPPTHRTGLVRLIEGSVVQNQTTTLYQSKVLGTFIDGRYAQVIESTSQFLVDKMKTIAPTPASGTPGGATAAPEGQIKSSTITPSPVVIEGTLDSAKADEENSTEDEDDEEEEDEDKEGGRKKSRLTFQSRKRTFTPVIRPFASRGRPSFAPKRKGSGPASAATIVRSDFTQTVSAVPVSKQRFGGRKASSVSNSALPGASTRRFAPRPKPNAASNQYSSTFQPNRGRSSSKISPTAAGFGSSSRRGGGRTSLSGGSSFQRGSSSLYNSGNRFRIRPTASVFNRNSVTPSGNRIDEENDLTPVTEDPTEVTDQETTLGTTPETPRRAQNPLLRFRRPPFSRSGTPPTKATAKPRSGNLRGNGKATTTPKPAKPTNSRPVASLQSRPRPGNSLFPRRNLFTTTTTTEAPEEEVEEEEDDDDEEEEDADYESSDAEEQTEKVPNTAKRNSAAYSPIRIKPFNFRRRSKRSTLIDLFLGVDDYNSRDKRQSYSRFRRPSTRTTLSTTTEEPTVETKVSKPSRYSARQRLKPTQKAATSTTTTNPKGISPSKPTRAQFTLREKGVGKPRTNYRRPSTSKRPAVTSRNNSSRLRGIQTESPNNRRRTTTSRRGSSTTSRRGSTRPRNQDQIDHNFLLPNFDGTITVTHQIPTEVTVPVVNGKITEYKNIITAQYKTEVLGPHQYATSVNPFGKEITYLLSESTGVNSNGLTQLTQYILNESPTTSVIFTPTHIRGRKTSYSHIVPSTAYLVEEVVNTLTPNFAPQAPLANILLSQLLLGGNPYQGTPGVPGTPTTEFKTRTTTYVTTVTSELSTVLPITFRGKEILTTIVDSSTKVVTATEFITDTIVVTPSAGLGGNNQLNSLLVPLLLQQQQQPVNPILTQPLLQTNPLLQNLQAGGLHNGAIGGLGLQNGVTNPANVFGLPQGKIFPDPTKKSFKDDPLDYQDSAEEETNDAEQQIEDFDEPMEKPKAKTIRKKPKKPIHPIQPTTKETSVITLYVSGRTPGDFTTVLSTVIVGEENNRRKREAPIEPSVKSSVQSTAIADVLDSYLTPAFKDVNIESAETVRETESLESIIGDVSRHIENTQRVEKASLNTKYEKASVKTVSKQKSSDYEATKHPKSKFTIEEVADEPSEDSLFSSSSEFKRKTPKKYVPKYAGRLKTGDEPVDSGHFLA